MEQQPLLTHDQLVDWLIYHCPMHDTHQDDRPFGVILKPTNMYIRYAIALATPWEAYEEMAYLIKLEPSVHREITDLYWYWTIY